MADKKIALDDKLHWYKDAIIYELHIKAFADSNGDGIGDFNGLIGKLDYLQGLGVTAIWLLPFYPSPLRDDGYDIADYYSINPSYGDIKQFKRLVEEAHERGLKVITELVINHSSDQHPWFIRARNSPKGSKYRNYYVWTDDPTSYKDVRIIFQDFEASNWTWDPVAKQYYWHRFFHHQPDLNFDNPEVQNEVFKVLNYWCKMGVDGFRLDAVPYLFERENTNGENLPETHDFLKKLRKHVDDNYPGTLLLAEANMWPEDSASYFGDGDECHMNYHFPVMPRMFMSLQMEDRYPITDIFEQTPAIPDTCQWAIFLRNHDELTLEMVTDEERDYMYKVYAKDPRAKINLGIRHRLAPLMENNRKKIELLNYLLFSLPGTPVIYYGDEIGMGDNVYLGDRNGVRTPMQWSADRNAGFSDANPHKLYLPVILDPEYHYESVNVELQSRNTSSLLWWMKRIINTRKRYKAFGRGDLQFINTENPKILAFTRTYENETMLVIANLSRYIQPVEMDLSAFKGYIPVEVFSKSKFPLIKEEDPYFFTLGPHDCQWFSLEKAHQGTDGEQQLRTLRLDKWKNLLDKRQVDELENHILPAYLMKVRWFGGKSRIVHGIKIIDNAPVPMKERNAYLLLIEVTYQSGLPEIYQLPITFATGAAAGKLSESCPRSIIANAIVEKEEGFIYDALFSYEYQLLLFSMMATHHDIPVRNSEVQFTGASSLKKYLKEHDKIRSKILSAEQSNTSITFDNQYFLKLYRKVDKAINPDLELTQFLSEKAKFGNIPEYIGAIKWAYGNESIVLGMMQKMVENNGDAWTYVLERLQVFNEKILAKKFTHQIEEPYSSNMLEPVRYEDVPEQLKEMLDAPLAERIRLLGQRTGEMHMALASEEQAPEFKTEAFSLHYQRSLYSSFQPLVRTTFQALSRTLKKLPAEVKSEAEEVLYMKDDILAEMKRIYTRKFDAVKTRIHGDYHLGQVLFTGKDFVILDFEGEPARPYSERRLKRSPLRDVAGMIRSFHYAAYGALYLNEQIRKEDRESLMPYADLWYHYISGFFLQAYLETVNGSAFVPSNKEDLQTMLDIYLLEKAIYELNYELNNRPDWVTIPLRGIKAIMQAENAETV